MPQTPCSPHRRCHRPTCPRTHGVDATTDSTPVSRTQNEAIDRRERLRRLALETIDLAKDPYFMRNHSGSYECKLCLTVHGNEGNYLAHTQGKRHQVNLVKRAARDQHESVNGPVALLAARKSKTQPRKTVKIGKPGYRVTKQYCRRSSRRSLLFQIDYPEIDAAVTPRHRVMSQYEQKVEPVVTCGTAYQVRGGGLSLNHTHHCWPIPVPSTTLTTFFAHSQYLLIAAEPYETIAFKGTAPVPSKPFPQSRSLKAVPSKPFPQNRSPSRYPPECPSTLTRVFTSRASAKPGNRKRVWSTRPRPALGAGREDVYASDIHERGGWGGCSGKHGGVRATRVWHGGVRGAAAAAAAAGKAARGRAAHGSAAAAAAQVRTRLRRGVKAVRGFRVGIERY